MTVQQIYTTAESTAIFTEFSFWIKRTLPLHSFTIKYEFYNSVVKVSYLEKVSTIINFLQFSKYSVEDTVSSLKLAHKLISSLCRHHSHLLHSHTSFL